MRILREAPWYVAHPRYPLAMPLAQMIPQEILGAPDDERIPRAIYAAFLPAFLLVLSARRRRRAGPRIASATVLFASLLPFLVFENHGGARGATVTSRSGASSGRVSPPPRRATRPDRARRGSPPRRGGPHEERGAPLALGALAAGLLSAVLSLRRARRARRLAPCSSPRPSSLDPRFSSSPGGPRSRTGTTRTTRRDHAGGDRERSGEAPGDLARDRRRVFPARTMGTLLLDRAGDPRSRRSRARPAPRLRPSRSRPPRSRARSRRVRRDAMAAREGGAVDVEPLRRADVAAAPRGLRHRARREPSTGV